MRLSLLILSFLAALPVLAHPGHSPEQHTWLDHASGPVLVCLALLATGVVVRWAVRRRRLEVLPLAFAMLVAVGAGTAGVNLPL